MKINYQSFLKVLCLTFLVLQSFGGFAQKTLANYDILLIPPVNQSLASVAWHPGYGRYYSSATGIITTPFFVYDSLGNSLSTTSSSIGNRGLWYNPSNGRIEGNDNENHYLYYPLDNTGTQVGDVILYPGYGTPEVHSGGVLNTSNGEILFYTGFDYFYRYSSDGTELGMVPITIPEGSNFNRTHMIYKGEPGREIGFFDYTNKRVYMYSISGGSYTYYYNLPSSAPNPSFGGFAYANGRFFLSNFGRWNGFPLVSPTITTSGSFSPFAACPGTASVPQSFIVSGSNISGDVKITAPAGFQVSRVADAGYTGNVYISSSNRTVPPTTVFVRIAASATGNLSGNMTITATGAETVSIALSGSSSLPGAVTVSGGGDFCDHAILTATGGSGGTIYWQNTVSNGESIEIPATTQAVYASGTYYFRAVNSAGCWGTQGSAEVNVTPLPDAPSPVSAIPDSICLGRSTQLSATSTGNLIKWYTQPSGGTAIGQSASAANFNVTPTGNTTYYAEARTPSRNILGDIVHHNNMQGSYTLGYEFIPNANLTVTGLRRYFGNKISIWTSTGTLIYSQNVSGVDGTWTDIPMNYPIELTAGTAYRIGVFTTDTELYYWNQGTYTFPREVDNGSQGLAYEYWGDDFPSTNYENDIIWLVDLTFAGGATCTSATRSEIAVNIFTPPTDGGTIDADQSICMGGTPELITSAELPAGTDGTIEYMWQASTVSESAGFANLSNSNSSSYQPSALNATTWFRRLAKLDCVDGWTGAVVSNVVEIAVWPAFNSGSITWSSEEFCGSGDPSIIESSEAATGGDGVITYKWTANNVLIPDATGASYDPPAGVTETTTYRRFAGDGSCTSELISEGAYTVTIHPLPVVSISVTEDSNISDDAVLCYGTSATLQATAEEGDAPGAPKSRGAIVNWVWDNAATLSDPLISNPVASPETGTTVYTVTYTDIYGCNDSESVSIIVLPEFTAGAIVNTETNLCYGVIPAQIGSITNAAGGDDNITYRWDANGVEIIGADEAFYTPTEGITETTVFTRRAKDGACNDFVQSAGSYTVIVEPTPVTGIITKMPDVTNICEDGFISAYLTAGSGGNGVDELEYRAYVSGSSGWSAWITYTPNAAISTTGLSGVEIRTRRMADYCENSDYSTVNWNIEPTAVAGVLTRIPDIGNVCENDVVSAVLTSGTGGNSNDELEYRTNTAEGWSAWTAYTSNAAISTTGLSGVEIRTRRIADYCDYSDYSIVSWTIEATPFAGILHKMPDINNICEHEFISAYLTAGRGGNGVDEMEYRTYVSGSADWSAWAAYTPNAAISTTGLSGVEIRTRRMADYCENSDYSTVSWTIEASPVTGVLTRIPDMGNVCENDVVSAILTSGTGGNGIDELEYRTYSAYGPGSWTLWSAYTSGNEISTNGLSGVEIRTRRMADFCQNASYNTVSWSIEATAWTGSLTKAPDVMNVCEGEIVSATVTPGFGGNGIDESEYRAYTPDGSGSGNWSEWTVYSSGEALTTIGMTSIEIRTHRTATYCPSSPYTTVSWNIEQTPVAGTLTITPEVMNVCEGEPVSALLTPGEGGNGVDELEYRTYAAGSWSAWAAYTSGNEISTGGISGVEIRTRRMATYCVNTDYMTVNWSIEPVAVAGMLIRIPDTDVLCMGSPVSAAFIPGNGGNGIDNVEFRSMASGNWSEWTNYVSGAEISTEGLSAIEVRTWREADWCGDSEVVTVGWAIDAPTEAGTITGGGQVCYGENSAVLTNTGYTGEILMWQSSVNNWQTVVDIMNTSPELIIQNLIQSTQYRTIVANGTCGQAYSAPENVTIVHLPAPYINGPDDLCGIETVTYKTASGAINYQWNVSNATIISGQGTSQITVTFDTPGSQEISVTYENVLGCTLENPFELQVQVNETPEKPEISVDWLNLVLTSSAATGNQWFQDGTPISGATNRTLTVTENGNYTVMTINASGCASEMSDVVSIMNVDVATADNVALSVYPNPTSGIITIDLNGPKVENYSMRIFDDMGREVVYEDFGRVSSVKKVIDLSDGYSGLYTVLIKCGDGFIVRKVILVKD